MKTKQFWYPLPTRLIAQHPSEKRGDDRMMDAFVEMLADEGTAPKTSIDVSVDSHIMAMAAEHSRLCGGQNVLLRDFAAQNTAGGCE